MTQDERWIAKYKEVIGFIMIHHRNPSRHRIEEHNKSLQRYLNVKTKMCRNYEK